MNALTAKALPQSHLPAALPVLLLVGSAAFLFANCAAQLLGANVLGHDEATASAAPWATAAYTLASFIGVATAQPLEQRFGTRWYFVSSALMLATFGLVQALAPSEPVLLAMRAFEGFASGSFGPRALLAAFLFYRGGRRSMALLLVGFFMLVACVIACAMFAACASPLGRGGLFLVQGGIGLLIALAGLRWIPRAGNAASRPAADCDLAAPGTSPIAASQRRHRRQRRGTALTAHAALSQ